MNRQVTLQSPIHKNRSDSWEEDKVPDSCKLLGTYTVVYRNHVLGFWHLISTHVMVDLTIGTSIKKTNCMIKDSLMIQITNKDILKAMYISCSLKRWLFKRSCSPANILAYSYRSFMELARHVSFFHVACPTLGLIFYFQSSNAGSLVLLNATVVSMTV